MEERRPAGEVEPSEDFSDGDVGQRDGPTEGDFAEEHSSVTVATGLEGGPERAPEPESPEGYAGMD